jgi:hypothetical protein
MIIQGDSGKFLLRSLMRGSSHTKHLIHGDSTTFLKFQVAKSGTEPHSWLELITESSQFNWQRDRGQSKQNRSKTMKISEAIQKLQELMAQVGDKEIEVDCDDENGGSYNAVPEFWFDGEETVVVRESWSAE